MESIKDEVRGILEGIGGLSVTYYKPSKKPWFPEATYFELSRVPELMYDNSHASFVSTVQIDAWDKSAGGADAAGTLIELAMLENGWIRTLARDLFDEDGIHRRNMRFIKEFFEEESDDINN